MKKKNLLIVCVLLLIALFSGCGKKEITEIYLQTEDLVLEIGESATLTYTHFPTDASTEGITYTSINPEIATVDESGLVLGVSSGKTNIVLSTLSGITASCQVTVKEPSAIELLNETEMRFFKYLTETALRSFYNASAVRFRNLYALAPAQGSFDTAPGFFYADIQGTNKLGGTIYKYYMMCLPDEGGSGGLCFPCVDTFNIDSTYVEYPAEFLDHVKINAALEEYWNQSSVTG